MIFRSQPEGVICAGHIEARGKALYAEVCQRDLEGIVAKLKFSTYSVMGQWLKIKNPHYSQAEWRHEMFTAFREKSSGTILIGEHE